MTTPTNSQQSMIRDAMKAIAERRPGKTKLVYDKNKRTIVAVAEGMQAPQALNISAEDADMFGVVTLSMPWLRGRWEEILERRGVPARLNSWDDGDALTQVDLGPQRAASSLDCTLSLVGCEQAATDVEITIARADKSRDRSVFQAPDGQFYRATAQRRSTAGTELLMVDVADVEPELHSRRAALLESTLLSERSVLCVGLGTGGAHTSVELAKSGVGRFILVDHDRLSVGNVTRHQVGISQVGRLKVNAVRDLILERNPFASVEVLPRAVTPEFSAELLAACREVDLVICGTDNRPSKLLVNRACIESGVPVLFGGAFRRAYGGQILYVRPPTTPCFQCFVSAMPDQAGDEEISSDEAAEAVAYSDRPVAVEPGLAIDVLPISSMMAKIALVCLAQGRSPALSMLARDYDAPWFLWINRPEPGTTYSSWPPLSESADEEMTINRWYGVHFEKEPTCPVCGDMAALATRLHLGSGTLPEIQEKA